MRTIKYTIYLLIILFVGGFLHYTLPRHDIVQVVDTEQRRVEMTWNAWFFSNAEPTNPQQGNRDVRFISTIRPNGAAMVYRNEDTGWGWPPYFKFDSSDVHARAAALNPDGNQEQWAMVTKYGWRNQLLSIYPNVIAIEPVEGPDVVKIPWFNIFFLAFLALFVLWLYRALRRLTRWRVQRVVSEVESAFETGDSRIDERRAQARTRWVRMREWWTEKFG